MNLLSIDTMELMQLWGEFVECWHGVNAYGGNTAEIYAYRLTKFNPICHHGQKSRRAEDMKNEIAKKCARQLVEMLSLFCEKWDCAAKINGSSHLMFLHFEHRVNVTIYHK